MASSCPSEGAKIVIIGAGISGLAAAHYLIQTYHFSDVTVLDAQDHVGGRIHMKTIENGQQVQLGAQFLHDRNNLLYKMADRMNLLPSKKQQHKMSQEDSHIFMFGGKQAPEHLVRIMQKCFDSTDKWLDNQPKDTLEQDSVGAVFERRFEQAIQASKCSSSEQLILQSLKQLYLKSVMTEHACSDLSNLSNRTWTHWEGNDDDDEVPVFGDGYQQILQMLQACIPSDRLQLNTTVTNIDWKHKPNVKNGVRLSTSDGHQIDCVHVIVTCPLGHPKHNVNQLFSPSLPTHKLNAINSMGFDTLEKVILVYERAFWPEGILDISLAFRVGTQSPSEPRRLEEIFWTFMPYPNEKNMLLAWITGSDAEMLQSASEEALGKAATNMLRSYTNYNVTEPIQVVKSCWKSNPLFCGSYSFYSKHADRLDASYVDLAEPLTFNDQFKTPCVQFAGEATHPSQFQTTHGAFESGLREAARLAHYYKLQNTQMDPTKIQEQTIKHKHISAYLRHFMKTL